MPRVLAAPPCSRATPVMRAMHLQWLTGMTAWLRVCRCALPVSMPVCVPSPR